MSLVCYLEKTFQQVNTNGVISFNAPYPTFNPAPFPMPNRSLIAPFMSDVDTRGIGEIYLKETSDPTLLQRASSIIHSATYQVMELPQFDPLWMLVATWYNVGHYNSGTNKVNRSFSFCGCLAINENLKLCHCQASLLLCNGQIVWKVSASQK